MNRKKDFIPKDLQPQELQQPQPFLRQVDNVREDFKSQGKRLTDQRKAILEILASTTSHPTVDTIYERVKKLIPNISLGTVYRNLGILRDQNLILELNLTRGLSRYDYNTSLHYHILCVRCGKLEDVIVAALENIQIKTALATGYQVLNHHIQFVGLCPQCKGGKS
ncbi:MAG: transcriptional repressor [Candidatus Tectomicrobia bacterium]|uniref:Transcriptional repressor n=1 Tax=Tectimicrobiota bacterium TaxID=2528274 RepID=A0A933GLU3_UNCTE|nr:transcriptional repressor [Candidatus Tectomicrobia bacterium]